MRKHTLFVLVLLTAAACQDEPTTPTPTTTPTSSVSVTATSPASGATVLLPPTWPQNARVLAPTVTVQFRYSESIPQAWVVVDLMVGSNVCLEAEGLQMGPGYATFAPYTGGSTITVTGNNFERNMGYSLCGVNGFTTDRLRFRLISRSVPGSPLVINEVIAQDVPFVWTFAKP